jgi:hypothetical protein
VLDGLKPSWIDIRAGRKPDRTQYSLFDRLPGSNPSLAEKSIVDSRTYGPS